jgi:multidrug resistance efflux pump
VIFAHKGRNAAGTTRRIDRVDAAPESEPAAARPRRGAGRALRTIIGVALLCIPGWFLMPALWTISSAQAIVNAQVITLSSPIEGVVTLAPPPSGSLVAQGSLLLQIDSPVPDEKHLDELKTELKTLTERVAALKQHLAQIETLKRELLTSFDKYKDSMITRIADELAEAKSEGQAAEAELRLRDFEVAREEALDRRGFGRPNELKETRFAAEVTDKKVARCRAAVARLSHQIESIKNGVFTGPGDSRNDVPYSRQRAHELTVQQLDDEAAIREHQARLGRLEEQIASEAERLRQQSSHQLTAPVDGIVWRPFVAAGCSVGPQTELLQIVDTSTIFIDAKLNEKYADDVRPGDKVVVRLTGSDIEVPGTVRQVVGEVLSAEDRTRAVEAVKTTTGHYVHVIVDFDKTAAGASEFNQCLIGRRAEVRFPELARSLFRPRPSPA